jgi:adenylate cyclase class IV
MEKRKIRINDVKETEKKLILAGAKFIDDIEVSDTYYNQDQGSVLKVTECDYGKFLVQIIGKNIIRHEKIEKPRELKNALKERYGRDTILDKRRKKYEWNEYSVRIYMIEEVGDFLVVTGENVPDSVFGEFGFEEPEFIEVPFSELAKDL